MPLSKEQVERLASLARLTLSPSETKLLSAETALVIDYFHRIQAFPRPPDSTDPYGSGRTCPLRPDETQASLERRRTLGQAPEHDREFFRVPGVGLR